MLPPRIRTNTRVILSAAPLSIRHCPISAASAITIPIRPHTDPKISATRGTTLASGTSGDSSPNRHRRHDQRRKCADLHPDDQQENHRDRNRQYKQRVHSHAS